MERIFDYLFYHCYFWARASDDSGKASIACHMMSYFLILAYCSVISLARLIMPRKFVAAIGYLLIIGHLLLYEELRRRYDDHRLREAIVKKYGSITIFKSLAVGFIYLIVSVFPGLLTVLLT